MTPEAQRIAIAEAHLKKRLCAQNGNFYEVFPYEENFCPQPFSCLSPKGWLREIKLADYLSDLNAMHEAEKYAYEHLMDGDQWEQYGKLLEKAHPCGCLKNPDRTVDYYDFATLMCEVTAAQRAEAFLRTLNLWKD